MPTYRDRENTLALDLKLLEDFLKLHEVTLYIKLHPFVQNDIDTSNYSHIFLINQDENLYEILLDFDILVSDYSSIMYDFLLLDRAMIAYCYDLEAYKNSRDGFLVDFERYTPAPIVKTQNELLKEIENILNNHDNFKKKRKKLREVFFDFVDNKSSFRIVEFLKKMV